MLKCILFIFAMAGPLLVQSRFLMPPPGDVAVTARYVVYKSAWASISTISTLKDVKSYPFVNVESISDGEKNNSTGIIYMYMTPIDLTGKDIQVDNRCTLLVTLAQSGYCHSKDYDPQDPRCVRVFITGRIIKLDPTSDEYKTGKRALFSRHPVMSSWPHSHDFYVVKVEIEKILLFDDFGGPKSVSVEDYYRVNPLKEQ